MSAPHMPMMNDEGLLECPFCGANIAYKDYDESRMMHTVSCGDCGCGTDEWLHEEGAVKSWNTRNGHLYTAEDFNQAAQERE